MRKIQCHFLYFTTVISGILGSPRITSFSIDLAFRDENIMQRKKLAVTNNFIIIENEID